MLGTWQGLANQPAFKTSTMILLTDGRVMVQEEATNHWHALTPDSNGSYVHGAWSTLADMNYFRRYYASGVLKDGRVIVIGGEQTNDPAFPGGDTNNGEIYDPVSDTWSPIPPPTGWANVGDASCCVLPDGRFMIGALDTPECIIYDPVTNSWSAAASAAIRTNEETWILQPDETILTVECFPPFHAEKYIISADHWKHEGALPVTLVDPVMSEIGPAMLLYNGKTIFFGAMKDSGGHGKTALYAPPSSPTGTGTWTAGPNIPHVGSQAMVCNDCPATLLPNGKVLFAAANYVYNDWGSPIVFFEYDPASNTISPAPTPANSAATLYWSRLMLLPTGQVLFSPSSDNVQCYTANGGPHEAWRPTISSITPHGAPDYHLLKGTQLNGLSQANIYGDDCSPVTNYPLVRLRNTLTNRVYFGRTYQFSTMAVATGASLQSLRFTTPNMPHGEYDVCVIANGISSHCVSFSHHKPRHSYSGGSRREITACCCRETYEPDPCCCEDQRIDPEIIDLKAQVKRLQNSVYRLASLVRTEEKDSHEKHSKKRKAADHGKERKSKRK